MTHDLLLRRKWTLRSHGRQARDGFEVPYERTSGQEARGRRARCSSGSGQDTREEEGVRWFLFWWSLCACSGGQEKRPHFFSSRDGRTSEEG